MNNEYFISQAEELLSNYATIRSRSEYHDLSDISDADLSQLISKSKAFVVRTVGNNSEYYKDITYTLEKIFRDPGTQLNHIMGTVRALKEDLENDYLKTYSELLNASIFGDYLEISEHLLDKGFKDSAAVIIGSTLETHLRKLCEKNGVELEIVSQNGNTNYKKANLINAELVKVNAYSGLVQKQITAWLGIRNSAAHGKYDDYFKQDIELMLTGVKNFINNSPA